MTLLDPVWLVLALPLAAALVRFRPPTRLLTALRGAAFLLLLLALAGLAVRLPSRGGTVVVVADRSRSMPAGSDAAHKELVDLLDAAAGGRDRLAVVSFGQGVAVEHAPDAGKFPGFTHGVGADASSLTEAVEAALALVPKDAPGRLVVLSDGRWTGREPTAVAALAAGRGVAVDYRHRARSATGDVAISRVEAPTTVAPGEGFLLTAWVQAPADQVVTFELTRGGQTIAAGEKAVPAGLSRLTFRDRAVEPGARDYRLRVVAAAPDPVPENNTARVLVGVSGPKPILHLTPGPKSGLTPLLQAGGLNVWPLEPGHFRFTLEELSKHSAVILENLPADTISDPALLTLAGWVKTTGAGLMVTGGRHAYGAGGYYKSPLEPILPVSMELRQEHRKLAVAIVVALDRSGSMAAPVPGGRVKMDLANLGAAQVLDLLGPMDEFGCFAVDEVAHTVAELGPVADKAATRDKILRIKSQGGGIFVYEALAKSADMVRRARAGTKHIVLFADAADAEEPGRYKELLDETRKAGITVSVIGLGRPADKDAKLLEDVASRGGGRLFITDKADELPRLFAQDTFVVARNAFLDEPVKLRPTAGLAALTGRPFALDRPIGGYNLCYLRPEATPAALTVDEYAAPAVASWQAGAGRVVCYTGEADGKHAGAFAGSPEAGEFYASLARWAAGPTGALPDSMAVTQEVRNGVNRVRLHLDPGRTAAPFPGTPQVHTLKTRPGEGPRTEAVPLTWVGPDTLAADVPLGGDETALSTVSIAGQAPQPLAPVCLPYSPEYAPGGSADGGREALERLARATGGVERVELGGVWADLPVRPRSFPLAPWLLVAAAVVVLLEVFERRSGLLSHVARLAPATAAAVVRRERPAPVVVAPLVPDAPPAGDVLDAMRKARDRTRGRP